MSEYFEKLRSALADRYKIGEEIGRGGMAVVYQAHDLKHDREVAIKVLRPELGVAMGADRFQREIAIEARLQHPNILALFDSGQVGEFLFYVMPLADGGSLVDLLEREQQLPAEDALRITREVGDALEYAHHQGIVHRDMKPGNILFSAGHAMIADFGIAHAVADIDEDTLTETGIAIGTPTYMSPEQATGAKRVDPRSDIYSLGCVLFEMLAGEPPFTGRTAQAVLARHISERPPSLEVVRPDLQPQVASAIGKALAKVPADRFASVDKFLSALDRPDGGATQRRSWLNSWRGAAAAAVGIVALIVGWLAFGGGGTQLSPNKIAVFPLAARGVGAANTSVGLDVAYLIEAALEQIDPLRLIDVTGRLRERELANPEIITSSKATDIAQAQNAAFYLCGVVQGHRDSTTVILRLFDVEGDSLIDQQSVTGATESVPLHHLGIDALKELLPALIEPNRDVDLSPLRNRRASAIALWMQGEREYRHSKFSSALDLYERALVEDSALAWAAVKGAQAANWVHENERGQVMVELALAKDSLLPTRHAVFARGLRDYFRGQADSAEHWLKEALRLAPDWSEAAAALGEVYYHLLPPSGPLDSLARANLARAYEADSGFAPPLFHLLEMHLRDGNVRVTNDLFDRFREAGPEPSLVLQVSLMRECVEEPAAMDWRSHTQTNSIGVFLAGKSLSAGALQHDCAEGAFRSILDSEFTPRSERWGAFLGLQGLLVATGRDQEARALIDSVVVRTGAARSLYVLNALAGARTEEQAKQLDDFARQRYGEGYEGIRSAESLWVLSLWHHHLGNEERLGLLTELIDRQARETGSSRDRLLAAAVAARSALLRDTTEAIEMLQQLPQNPGGNLEWGFGDAVAPERLLLAELLLEQGLYRESMRVAAAFDHPQPIMFLPYVALSLSIRNRAAMALGDTGVAELCEERLRRLHRVDLTDTHTMNRGGN